MPKYIRTADFELYERMHEVGYLGAAQFAQVNQALLPLASLQEGVARLA